MLAGISTPAPVRLQREQKVPLSKAGNRYLWIALYMPALSAARHDPNVSLLPPSYYRHLTDTRGLKELQAICAVMRKLLLAIHAMLRTNSPFDSRRLFPPTETTT